MKSTAEKRDYRQWCDCQLQYPVWTPGLPVASKIKSVTINWNHLLSRGVWSCLLQQQCPTLLLRQVASCPMETRKGCDLVSHLCMVTSGELHLPHHATCMLAIEKGGRHAGHGVGDGREQRGGKHSLPGLRAGLAVGCTEPPSSLVQPESWPPLPYLPCISLLWCSLLLFYSFGVWVFSFCFWWGL